MKISILSIAMLSLALTACPGKQNADSAATTPAADSMASDNMSSDASKDMSNMPADNMGAMDNQNPMVGGAPMYASKDIVENAMQSQDHTTLVAAVKAAGLVDTLKGPGPFTVFAPTNAAFDALPAGTVDKLMKPDMKADLTKVLTYHVVPGKLDVAALKSQIMAGGGKAMLKTVQGEDLTAMMDGDAITLTDAKGNVAHVTTADVMQSNGVIHVIDKVLMP